MSAHPFSLPTFLEDTEGETGDSPELLWPASLALSERIERSHLKQVEG